MDDTKHQKISETLDVWTIDGEAKLRDGGMFAHIITLTPGEAVDLADWILYTYLEIERPERIVPEQTDDMPF